MQFGSTVRGLLKLAQVALAAVLFAIVPSVDAFACAGETFPAPAATETIEIDGAGVAGNSGHGSQPGSEAQHCHHCMPLGADAGVMLVFTNESMGLKPHGAAVILTRASNGLERPPKI